MLSTWVVASTRTICRISNHALVSLPMHHLQRWLVAACDVPAAIIPSQLVASDPWYHACMQALAAPAILSKQDVVLAAETGSGKTLAYITPVASALLDAAADLDPERRG